MEVFKEAASPRSMGHVRFRGPRLAGDSKGLVHGKSIQLYPNMRVDVWCVKDGGTPGLRHPRARNAEHVGQVIRDPLFLVAGGSAPILVLLKPA